MKKYFLGAVLSAGVLINHLAEANLLNLINAFATELEVDAALANQQVYERLLEQGCQDTQRAPSQTGFCTGNNFVVFTNVRELVHTANDLIGQGPTQFSLQLGLEGLGFALRWTAAEEYAAQGSLSSSFVNGQLSNLASRISALRRGSRGFSVTGLSPEDRQIVQSYLGAESGSASAENLNLQWTRWGGFLNGTYLYGDRSATELEDAFDYDGQEINAGVDYRLTTEWVLGVAGGYLMQEVDFDSSQSIVDGGIEVEGWSLTPFFLYQSDSWYFSGSVGYQALEFDTERAIRYPSNNEDSDDVDTTAVSVADADIISLYGTVGYNWQIMKKLAVEPYLTLEYQDISVDEYSEVDLQNDGFNFIIPEQNYDSLEVVTGFKLQMTFSGKFGVVTPFADMQWRNQEKAESRNIEAIYAEADGLTQADSFVIPTEAFDSSYLVYSIGLASVLRGAAQKNDSSPASGGIQGFVNWRFIDGLEGYNENIISAGLRYEF